MALTEKLQSASFESKNSFILPEDAVIIKKDCNITVREIENGYVVRKSYDIKYMVEDDSRYDYFSKEYYSKTNPLTITMKETSLADKF